jgi:hypothetical protein
LALISRKPARPGLFGGIHGAPGTLEMQCLVGHAAGRKFTQNIDVVYGGIRAG